MGRADKPEDFIKRGCEWAAIEIELYKGATPLCDGPMPKRHHLRPLWKEALMILLPR